jgi:hypothetical protein
MDATRFLLDIFEFFKKTISVICYRPYVAVEVQLVPPKDKSGTPELIAFTVINEIGPDIEVQEAWFLTSYNRRILCKYIDSKLPEKVLSKDRAIYFVPLEELKAALNKGIGETITEAVVFDKAEHLHTGRVHKLAEIAFAK